MRQAVWLAIALTIIVGGYAAAQALHGGHASHPPAHLPPTSSGTGLPPAAPIALPAGGESHAPTAADALSRLERLEWVHIKELAQFNPENGVRRGTGTIADPFVLEGFYARELILEDVEAAYVIRDVYVSGTLRIDYTGAGSRVENSTIGFLTTDSNIPHTAPHTWLDVRDNVIGEARIRHAGGVFASNVVGAPGNLAPHELALEVQGYNGLLLANNVVHGPVEFRLHGHHYAPSYEAAWAGHDHHASDPAQRYHHVRVVGNVFADATGKGVAISDRDHAANHGTAKSETDPRLDKEHTHHLLFEFEANRVMGAGIKVEDPNAEDEDHVGGEATIRLVRNVVSDPLEGNGILVKHSHGALVEIVDNEITTSAGRVDGTAGVKLKEIEDGRVVVRGGLVSGFEHGIRAYELAERASWAVEHVAFEDVGRAVYWDKSVDSAPAIVGVV